MSEASHSQEAYGQGGTQPVQVLDLRTTKCPLNFVKARLALEKLSPGDLLEIWLAAEGESALNVPTSLRQEGHRVENETRTRDGSLALLVRRGEYRL